jgi:hypothetical protein
MAVYSKELPVQSVLQYDRGFVTSTMNSSFSIGLRNWLKKSTDPLEKPRIVQLVKKLSAIWARLK